MTTRGWRVIPWQNAKRAIERIRSEGLPPQIVEQKRRIEAEIRNAEQLMVLFGGVIDYGAVEKILAMKLELDAMYGNFAMES